MQVGCAIIFQGFEGNLDDKQVYETDLALADLVEPLGFDSVWGVEHHFTNYTMCPDVIQFLTYMAGRTKEIKLGSMVAVLPWHDPIRLAEQILMLDNLSNGRLLLGMGRGTGVVEFDGLRVDMGEARQRFKESAEAILEALETGYIECDGEYIKQPRTPLRPGPFKSFKGRTYSATISPESAEIMARLGTGILIVPQKPWNQTQQDCITYTKTYLEAIGEEPPAPICSGWTFVHEDADKAEEMARQYVGGYWRSIVDHYEFDKPHLKSTPGYEFHSLMYDRLNAPNGLQRMTDFYIGLQPWGTPEQVIEKIRHFCQTTGANTFVGNFRFGGMSYEEAESSMRLFAGEVMPALRQMEFSSPLPMAV